MKAGAEKKKSMAITAGVHVALLVLGLLPLTRAVIEKQSGTEYIIPIEFAEFAQSSDEGLQATSENIKEVLQPVVERELERPDAVEDQPEADLAQMDAVEEVESDAVQEEDEVVSATESEEVGSDDVASAESGQDAGIAEGPEQGSDAVGNDEGQRGIDGDGVITRQVVYRRNIGEAAYESGMVVVDVCIDREGRILTAANNAEGTTIDDMGMVREVLNLVAEYRFETDYSAALRECGRMTFVFDIEDGIREYMEDSGSYAANE